MAKAPSPDIMIIKNVIFTLNNLQFPLEAARRGDENMSKIAGCLEALEQLVAKAEDTAMTDAVKAAFEEVTDDA